ncbi:MAG: hypothetical protein GC168_20880 [Candidatus Hydrogenedens sp.]|nr:hypothetical protein [Candidatus Hydrogenedens sp.]
MKRLTSLLAPALVLALAGCTTTKVPFTDVTVPVPRMPFKWWQEDDLSQQLRSEAFRRLIQTLTWEYPYTEHKGIQWQALEARFLPRIQAADATDDNAEYYFALRDFAETLRDGNVSLSEKPEFLATKFGGGYGMTLGQLDDGRVMVRGIRAGFPAQLAGITAMSEILTWNGEPIGTAVLEAPMLWGGQPPTTAERAMLQRLEGITRVPVGTAATVEYRAAGSMARHTVNLTAMAEPWSALKKESVIDSVTTETQSPVRSEFLDGNIGYIEIRFFSPSVSTPFPERAFRNALREFNEKRVKGLIIDLRHNSGGLEDTATRMLGHFVTQPEMFRTLSQYRPDTGLWEDVPSVALSIQTAEPYVYCPVIVLVHGQTSRTAETFAWGLRRYARARLVGTSSTRGAAPSTEQEVVLPGDISFFYPTSRWLGPEGNIRIETDAYGGGGLEPDVRVPMNEANFKAKYLDERDISLGQAIKMLNEE